MAKAFIFTDRDIKTFEHDGFTAKDIEQIKRAVNACKYTNEKTGGKISAHTAYNLLGRSEFLSGIGRAAFHASAYRASNGNEVYFSCYKFLGF